MAPNYIDGLMQERHNSIANDGLMQEKHNSIANALELRLLCTNPSIWDMNTYLQFSCQDIHTKAIFESELYPQGK